MSQSQKMDSTLGRIAVLTGKLSAPSPGNTTIATNASTAPYTYPLKKKRKQSIYYNDIIDNRITAKVWLLSFTGSRKSDTGVVQNKTKRVRNALVLTLSCRRWSWVPRAFLPYPSRHSHNDDCTAGASWHDHAAAFSCLLAFPPWVFGSLPFRHEPTIRELFP